MNDKNHAFVICAYGDSPYLEECVQSLLNQTIQSQVILYTSTPSEHIENICQKYSLPYFIKEGGSIGKDWNNALSCVDTKYATIAHQDDYYGPRYAEVVLEKARKVKKPLILFTNYFEEKDEQPIAKTLNLKIKTFMLQVMSWFPSSTFWRTRILAFGNAICCPAVTYNLDELKSFRFDEELRGNLDWIAWYKIGQMGGSFAFINQDLMCHRIHEESETSKTISDNTRTNEDLATLSLFWPKWIAKLIMKFYVKSQATND